MALPEASVRRTAIKQAVKLQLYAQYPAPASLLLSIQPETVAVSGLVALVDAHLGRESAQHDCRQNRIDG